MGPEHPLAVIRVRGAGGATGEEDVACGGAWRPTQFAVERASRTQGYSALEVDADTAERAARRWAYTYHRIVERSSDRTVAFVRLCEMPVTHEQSTVRSGVWEHTRRLKRIEQGLDDYRIIPVDADTVDQYVRELATPEYRYFAVVTGVGDTDFGLANPADVLRVRAGEEKGTRERLGAAMTWEPFDAIDGADGVRELTLLEIDEETVAAAGRRGSLDGPAPQIPEYTYFVFTHGMDRDGDTESTELAERVGAIVRQWPVRDGVQEEQLRAGPRWTASGYGGKDTRKSDPQAIEVSAATVERLAEQWRYSYHAILPEAPDGDEPLAVVRHSRAPGDHEQASVGWPIWDRSCWLEQISAGRVRYRAEEVDAAAVERFLRRVAASATEYRYFAILDSGDSIDAPQRMVRGRCGDNGSVLREETPRRDGSWVQTHTILEVNHGRGSWWLDPVEVPVWLFERYRAKLLASS